MIKSEPNLDLIKVLIEAKNQKNIFDNLNHKINREIIVEVNPWESFYTNTIETIWIFLN